jgi:hypothetical protein
LGLIGFESNETTINSLSNQNAFVQTQLSRYGPGGVNQIVTDYFRTRFRVPFHASSFILRHVVDDGAVFYLNGAEVARFNMTNGVINHQTYAIMAPLEGVIRTNTFSQSLCADNLLAVEVHQSGPVSNDVLFGLELLADVPHFSPTTEPAISIHRNPNGTITLTWCGTLLESEHPNGLWTPVNAPANPLTVVPSATTHFYTVRP